MHSSPCGNYRERLIHYTNTEKEKNVMINVRQNACGILLSLIKAIKGAYHPARDIASRRAKDTVGPGE